MLNGNVNGKHKSLNPIQNDEPVKLGSWKKYEDRLRNKNITGFENLEKKNCSRAAIFVSNHLIKHAKHK